MAKQTAIVTGAAGNLGQAVVQNFLNHGLTVAGTVLAHEHDRVNNFDNTPDFQKYEVDVTNEDAAKQLVSQVIQKNGTIDVAALLVGGFAMGNLQQTRGEHLRKLFSLNFESAFYLAREIFAQMASQATGGQGRIPTRRLAPAAAVDRQLQGARCGPVARRCRAAGRREAARGSLRRVGAAVGDGGGPDADTEAHPFALARACAPRWSRGRKPRRGRADSERAVP